MEKMQVNEDGAVEVLLMVQGRRAFVMASWNRIRSPS